MSVRSYCQSTISDSGCRFSRSPSFARPRRALALGLGFLALGLIWPSASLASPSLSGTTLTASTEVANIEACLDPVGEITHGISHSGPVAGPYGGTFDGFVNVRQASEGGPVRTVGGDYTLTDDADAEYAKARVVLTFDSGVPSSCNSSGTRAPVDYDIDVVAHYSAYLVMDDGRICTESGDAAVSATGTGDGTTASGSMTVTLGPPPESGGDISCSNPEITASPSSGLPRKRTQRVTIEGTGFAPGQALALRVCNAFNSDPPSCQGVDGVQADQAGAFSSGYFSEGVHNPVHCDDGGGGGAPCRIVVTDVSLADMPLSAEASISYAPYPTVTTVGASTTLPDTLEVTGTNLDQFRWLEMLTGYSFFTGAPWLQDTPGYMSSPPGTVINEWSASRISITWPAQYLNQYGRQVQRLQFSDEIRDTLVVPASFTIPAEIDSVPPDPPTISGPSGFTNDPTPTFSFSSEPGASFECKIDSGPYAACGSPKTTPHLADGSHAFSVRATDAAGNTSDPTVRSFTVRTAEVKVSGSTLVVTAAAGAKDNFVIARVSASTLRVTDLASGAYTGSGVHTGAGCTRMGSHAADCPAAGITLIQVTSADQIDKVTNSTALRSSLNGGAGNDLLTGGSANDLLIGATGADVFRGMAGNDDLRARDLVSDGTIDCGAGAADKADLDLLPRDPNSSVTGCETKTRH